MTPRSIGTVTITLGLVAIPTKLYTATSKREVAFNRLERATGARVKQPTVSSVSGAPLEGEDVVSGFEYTPEKYVTFSADELKALELEADPDRIRIVGVVPAATVDPTHVIKSVFLGPNKGASRAYALLEALLSGRGQVAIGQWGGRSRDALVLVSPHASGHGLVLHECLYPDEVRASVLAEAVPADATISPDEMDLGVQLLDGLTRPSFLAAAAALTDGGAARVQAAVARKVAGHEVVVPVTRQADAPIDLLEQLRASVPPPRSPKRASRRAPASEVQSGRRARRAS